MGKQRAQSENAALSVVVGAHNEDEVFDTNNDDECPEDNRQSTIHNNRVERECRVSFRSAGTRDQ